MAKLGLSTEPLGSCSANGEMYMEGETVFEDPNKCHDLVCVRGTIVHLDNPCLMEPCSGIVEHVHGQCCPLCQPSTSTLSGPLPPVGK
ncbi:hypothetical protein DPMN_026287 [Dreissena polymorpha]|uniref:VWFC domain-containing protein n=1 Tax=Dreissena polymorpha TaxID=45954 RepID=A0A9D4LUW3_DREPO|nr:hypothetical protein DPMN_026287 [Dreissena polymorpha]